MTFGVPLTWGCQEMAKNPGNSHACSHLGESCSFPETPFLVWKGLHLAGRGWVKLDISRFSQHPPPPPPPPPCDVKGQAGGSCPGWQRRKAGRPGLPERTLRSSAGLQGAEHLAREGVEA